MSGIRHEYANLGPVDLHYVQSGPSPDRAPSVVLLHGWPQTWYCWRHLIPVLATRFHVIAPDLRGLGDSSRPLDGYDKASIGADIHALLSSHLGLDRYHVVGHDWGGPVAFRVAVADPAKVLTLTVMDVTLPGIGPDISQGGQRWHHAFHRTPDLPERLIQGRERDYLEWFYHDFSYNRGGIDDAAIDEYVRCYSKPGALRAGFAYYRAIPQDVADNQRLIRDEFRLRMPVLAMGGAVRERRGRGDEPAQSLAEIADEVTGKVVERCGHFMAEDRPDAVQAALLEHFERA
ncbi:MAG: alpha/beta hydrolase [Gammaproteobacteria bacterium]|nr:alpha/beta hydrolase [Gammaproteobacteria bacterium]